MAGGAAVDHLEGTGAWGGPLGVTRGLVEEFGRERVRDTPISETAFIGAAVGAAATGLRPVAELMFISFIGVAFDQLLNQASKLRYMFGGKARVPMTIRTLIGAGFRAAAQHSMAIYSVFAHIPGLKVVVPSDPADAKGLLAASIRDDDPVVFCEHIALYNEKGNVPEGEYVVPLGRAAVKRPGSDVTVVAIGRMVRHALEAARALEREGVEVEVVDPRTLHPLDEDTILESVRRTGRLVVVDEANPRASMAADITATVSTKGFDFLDAPPVMVTAPHAPVPFSPVLEDAYIPSPARIQSAVRQVLGR